MNRAAALAALIVGTVAIAAPVGTPDEVLRVFRDYEALNADFVHSVSAGSGRTGKSYSQLRRETEEYAEGPFAQALATAQALVCKRRDQRVLSALLSVMHATSNSSNEAPTTALVQIAQCQPGLLRASIGALPAAQRRALANRAPQLRSFAGREAAQ